MGTIEYYYDLNELVINGDKSALGAYLEIKKYVDELEKIKAALYEQAILEMEREGIKETQIEGNLLTLKQGAKRFDFSNIDKWVAFKKQMEEVEEEAKQAYALYEKGTNIVVNREGEILTLPIVKYNKTSITVTKAK